MASWRGASVQEAVESWHRSGAARGAAALVGLVAAAAVIWVVVLALADDEVVLVVPSTGPAAVEEGDRVLVRGVVRDTGEAAGGNEDFADFQGANAIFATAVEPAPEGATAAGGSGIDAIAEDEDLVGEAVTVVGEVTEDDVGPRGFVLEKVE